MLYACLIIGYPNTSSMENYSKADALREANANGFKDTLKASLKAFSINPDTWEEAATDRPGWRSLIHKGAVNCEDKRTLVAEEKRLTRKLRASTDDPGDNLPCPNCDRTFRATIGLPSHLRTHLPK